MQGSGYILVVDDEADIVEFVVDFLREEGYSVRGALDGDAALTAIADQAPAVILLDLLMPSLNGMALWEHLKLHNLADIPVVLMTASPHAAEAMLASGATEYLPKPFDLDQLLACVARYVRRNGAGGPAITFPLPS
jgi:DNA-binding response OmpR family regulator